MASHAGAVIITRWISFVDVSVVDSFFVTFVLWFMFLERECVCECGPLDSSLKVNYNQACQFIIHKEKSIPLGMYLDISGDYGVKEEHALDMKKQLDFEGGENVVLCNPPQESLVREGEYIYILQPYKASQHRDRVEGRNKYVVDVVPLLVVVVMVVVVVVAPLAFLPPTPPSPPARLPATLHSLCLLPRLLRRPRLLRLIDLLRHFLHFLPFIRLLPCVLSRCILRVKRLLRSTLLF